MRSPCPTNVEIVKSQVSLIVRLHFFTFPHISKCEISISEMFPPPLQPTGSHGEVSFVATCPQSHNDTIEIPIFLMFTL